MNIDTTAIKKLKKIGILLAIPLGLFIVAVIVTPLLMNTEQAKQQLTDSVASTYGLTLQTSKEPEARAYPAPTIYFSDISLSDASGKEVVVVPAMKVVIGWLGLFSDQISSVELVNPELRMTADQLDKAIDAYHANTGQPFTKSYILSNARLELIADKENTTYLQDGMALQDVFLTYNPSLAGSTAFFDTRFNYRSQAISQQLSYQPNNKKLTGNINVGSLAAISLDGTMEQERWKGTMSFDAANVLEFTNWLKQAPAVQTNEKQQAANVYSLSFSAPAEITADYLMVSRHEAKLNSAPAGFAAFVGWANHISLGIELNPDSLQLDQFIHDFGDGLLPTSAQRKSVPSTIEPLPDYLTMSFLMSLPDVKISDKRYQDLELSAELEEGNVEIHQAHMIMPGESTIRLDGSLRQTPEGRRFFGSTKVSGKHFNEWLANFEPYAQKLPEDDFSDFNFEGNLFISKEQLRLSEADLRIGELGFQGGFAAFFDQIPRVEAEIRLTDINLDYFRDIWRKQEKTSSPGTTVASVANFEWLRRLPAVLDFRINIDGFTFLDTPGTFASTRLYSRPGEILLNGVDLRMKNNVIGGNIKLDVTKPVPELSMVMNASRFNTSYFLAKDKKKQSRPLLDIGNKKQRWSEELIDLSILDGINGTLDITIGALTHDQGLYQNFKWLAELQDRVLNIKRLSFSVLEGTFSMNGSLIGGRVPGIKGAFSLYNADLKDLLSKAFGINTISGRVSMSGVVGMSGISPKAWLDNSDMKLTAAARGVQVRNLNLERVIALTKAARSTKDVREGIAESMFDGVTELTVDGNINIRGGMAKTPGIRLQFGRILGNLKGEVDLLGWKVNLASFWQFPELSSSTIPTMSIAVQGDIDDYKARADTSSLEAFVAKRIVGQ